MVDVAVGALQNADELLLGLLHAQGAQGGELVLVALTGLGLTWRAE